MKKLFVKCLEGEDGNGEMLSCNPQYFAKHYTRDALKGE